MSDPYLGGEGSGMSGQTPDDEDHVGVVQPGGKGQESERPRRLGPQEILPGTAAEKVLEVQLQGYVPWAERTGPTGARCRHAGYPPRDTNTEQKGASDGPAFGQAAVA
jgi:hypothetical protein